MEYTYSIAHNKHRENCFFIRKLIKDDEFVNSLNDLEFHGWKSFVDVVKNFLGNCQAESLKKWRTFYFLS